MHHGTTSGRFRTWHPCVPSSPVFAMQPGRNPIPFAVHRGTAPPGFGFGSDASGSGWHVRSRRFKAAFTSVIHLTSNGPEGASDSVRRRTCGMLHFPVNESGFSHTQGLIRNPVSERS